MRQTICSVEQQRRSVLSPVPLPCLEEDEDRESKPGREKQLNGKKAAVLMESMQPQSIAG
jgi:hypothetical protein